ncbi:MFS transporter [Bacillus pseudomycoides]|uniref:MFS transporter n=1 Tax=Bacillus TaxID=1386 RepID=UPI002248E78A|nr:MULTISPECIES: MFS transporter [Bacillus]MCX2829868.1 MFS transporter [Bacillus sp. DHT2]MDR4918814.1 MFS transporter [Bacillus pseudomycoides]
MNDYKILFRNKNLSIVLFSQLVFQLGIWFGTIGNLRFLQLHLTSSFFQAFFLVIGGVIGVLIGPYAGRYIDSTSKTKVLQLVGIMRIISVICMLLAIYTDSLWWMLVYSIGIGCSASFFNPTIQSIIPKIIHTDQLIMVNAINVNIITVSRIFGAVLAGVLLTIAPLYTLFLIALIAYVLLYILNQLLVVKEDDFQRGTAKSTFHFREIIPLFHKNYLLKMVLILSIIPLIFISGFNLFVIEISHQSNSSIMGILYFVEGTSILIAGFFVKKLVRHSLQPVKILLLICFFMGISQWLLSFSIISLSIFAFGLFGLAYGIFNPLLYTFSQQTIPSELHGRFFSLKTMLDRTVLQLFLVLIGFLLDYIGYQLLVMALGTLTIVIVICSFIIYRFQIKKLIIPNQGINEKI